MSMPDFIPPRNSSAVHAWPLVPQKIIPASWDQARPIAGETGTWLTGAARDAQRDPQRSWIVDHHPAILVEPAQPPLSAFPAGAPHHPRSLVPRRTAWPSAAGAIRADPLAVPPPQSGGDHMKLRVLHVASSRWMQRSTPLVKFRL